MPHKFFYFGYYLVCGQHFPKRDVDFKYSVFTPLSEAFSQLFNCQFDHFKVFFKIIIMMSIYTEFICLLPFTAAVARQQLKHTQWKYEEAVHSFKAFWFEYFN